MWSVTLRPKAEADLVDARQWYDDQRFGLGEEFLAAVAESLLDLENSPHTPAIYYRDFRRLLTKRFPYKIFYRIVNDQVIVFRILHSARDHERELRGL
jgi:plasmid stabilization system protein ParE